MTQEWRKRIQLLLLVFLLVAGIRLFLIYRERHEPAKSPEKSEQTTYKVGLDDYVAPRKLHAYDLQSAKYLIGKSIWVHAGNQLAYYAYDGQQRRARLDKEAGLLPPLEKLEVKDVSLQNTPGASGQKQLLAIFQRRVDRNETYAVPIGKVISDNYNIYFDDGFFLEDPHELYKHWPADVWNAIDRHEAKPGMNELQTSFALGTSGKAGAGDYGNRSMEYANAGKPVTVTFAGNRAVKIEAGSAQ
jgi:hypothetical protein